MASTYPDNLTTPSPGFPYSLIADLAVLANDVQTALTRRGFGGASGQVNVTTANNSVVNTSVTFPVGRFETAPQVSATPSSNDKDVISGGCGTSGVTKTGFTLHTYRASGSGAVTYHWIAHEDSPS